MTERNDLNANERERALFYDNELLYAKVARLKNALSRFANIKADDGDDFSSLPEETVIRCEVTVQDLKVARELLK